MNNDVLSQARAEALAMSTLSASVHPDRAAADAAIRASVLRYGGVRGCAAAMAQEFGDRPETACVRMRWANSMIENLYAGRRVAA